MLWLAALAGAAACPMEEPGRAASAAGRPRRRLLVAGLTALTACLTAACFFGTLPGFKSTLTLVVARTYQSGDQLKAGNPRAAGTAANRQLQEIVAEADWNATSVLATGRIAAHLLGVPRLESVEQATLRWPALCREAGPGRSGIEVFDWVVLDTQEGFQQSSDKVDFICCARPGRPATGRATRTRAWWCWSARACDIKLGCPANPS